MVQLSNDMISLAEKPRTVQFDRTWRPSPTASLFPAQFMQNTVRILTVIIGLANLAAGAAQSTVLSPSTWWVAGPFPSYDQAMFEANEPIENANNNHVGGVSNPEGENEWNRVIAIAGRELRTIRVGATESGAVDLARACGGGSHACAYAGARMAAEKEESAPATLTGSGPTRWFFNNKLVGETKEKGVLKVTLPLKKGWNALLAKSWNPTNNAEWSVRCKIASASPLTWESPTKALASSQPATGRRNVALWSEGSRVGVSSIVWRGCPTNERGLSMLNDGLKPGSPEGAGAAWNSHEVDGLPQWAWVRFPGLRTIDSVAIYCGGQERWPIALAGEYSEDGGVTFKTLFEIKNAKPNPKDASLRAEFPAVATDNVRIRITRAEVPSSSAFATAQLTEIEVFGDNAPGSGSLALGDTVPRQSASSELKPERDFRPQIKEKSDQVEFSTPWYRVALDRSRPRIARLSLDSLGKGEFKIALLRNTGAMALVGPMFDPVPFPQDGALKIDGNVARYPSMTVAPGVTMAVALRFHEKSFELELSTVSGRSMPLSWGVFRFDLDFWQTPTCFFGRATDPAHFVTLPCYIHAPDAGTFRVTQRGDGAILRQAPSADDFNLSARQLMDIAPYAPASSEHYGIIPAKPWRTTLQFAVESVEPFPDLVASEPRLNGLPRYALNIAQWMPGKKLLSNNVVSTNCPLSLQFYAEMAVYAPRLKDGIDVMELVTASVDRYLDGVGGHLMWHGMRVEVQPPGKWVASLETGGFILNSAWYAVQTVGGKSLLKRWLPRLEALAGHLEAHDTDGDGIVDSGDRGHWFDNYMLPAGVKEAHSTAVNYEAYLHLANLEEMADRKDQAAHYKHRAQLIKDNYLKVFYNPETGVIGGWRDKEGKLHDPMFPWVNGYAICAGLVSDELANQILDRLFAQMKMIGFTQYQYGLPTNLLPMQKDEWNYGPREWQGYMNGSITPPYSNYVIMALYKMGRREQAEELLWPQIASFDRGTFNSGVRIPYMQTRNPVGSAFYYWDGSRANGEGYLPENWHAYAGIFAGHFGIRFGAEGYSLEPWSPLKGKRVPCGLPVMGKIQESME